MNVDVAIVGAGPIGAAAARYLAGAGCHVAIIGPPEAAPGQDSSHAVYASHYDEGRIGRRLHQDPIWQQLAAASLAAYPALESATGIHFFEQRGALIAAAPGQAHGRLDNEAADSAATGVSLARLSRSAAAVRFPMLRFPPDSSLLYEGPPAGFINPRSLVRAQLAAAAIPHLPRIALTIKATPRKVSVTLDDGSTVHADRVLVAAGPYTNSHHLLPRKLALRVKSESIVFARLAADSDAPYQSMPVVSYGVDDPVISKIYLLPPIRYPDGELYVKMGANTVYDQTLVDRTSRNRWIAAGPSALAHAALRRGVEVLLHGLPATAWHTSRCLITYSGHGKPQIDAVSDRIFVAVAGNGNGAHISDALGRLAAERIEGRWTSPLPQTAFRAQFADQVGWTHYASDP